MDELYTNSAEFLRAVMALRAMSPQFRSLAHHAADFWSNDELVERALRADALNRLRVARKKLIASALPSHLRIICAVTPCRLPAETKSKPSSTIATIAYCTLFGIRATRTGAGRLATSGLPIIGILKLLAAVREL